MRELQALESRLRRYVLACGMLRRAQVDPADHAAADKWLDAWLESKAGASAIGAYKAYASTYRDVRDVKPALDARAEDIASCRRRASGGLGVT